MYPNGTATMTLSVSFLGQPVQKLNVSWIVTGGSVSPNPTRTGSSGATSTTFKPNKAGVANITASASSPLTGSIKRTYLINVFLAPLPPSRTPLQIIESLWYYVAVAVAVVFVALFYLLRMRRKKQRAQIEAGFEVV
jgi:hypothetical protein